MRGRPTLVYSHVWEESMRQRRCVTSATVDQKPAGEETPASIDVWSGRASQEYHRSVGFAVLHQCQREERSTRLIHDRSRRARCPLLGARALPMLLDFAARDAP